MCQPKRDEEYFRIVVWLPSSFPSEKKKKKNLKKIERKKKEDG